MVCHGPVGISMAPDAPNLAGQPALYVTAQLKAYRAGERRHEVMAVIAKMLSDDDIENLAAWYASIRVEAQAPDCPVAPCFPVQVPGGWWSLGISLV